MSSSYCYDWQNLFGLIFSDIMMMLGLESFEVLQKCRQVCQNWNVMLSQMTRHKKGTIIITAKGRAAQIRGVLVDCNSVQLPEIAVAASLAHHGVMDTLQNLWLRNVDLSSVPAQHLASLASCVSVTGGVDIFKVNCDLIPILDNVKCWWLRINNHSLSLEETRELVRAMESNVEIVVLVLQDDPSLDSTFTALIQYSGHGKCFRLDVHNYRRSIEQKHREEAEIEMKVLRRWAQEKNWAVEWENYSYDCSIRRK